MRTFAVIVMFLYALGSQTAEAGFGHGLDWSQVTDLGTGFLGQSAIVYQGKIWAWTDGYTDYDRLKTSVDGSSWTLVYTENYDQGPRSVTHLLVFRNELVVLGWNGVWASADGSQWRLLGSADYPGQWREDFTAQVFNNQLYIMGGEPEAELNDVWRTGDGVTWEKVTDHAEWSPRYGLASVVFAGKLWIVGGALWNVGEYDDTGSDTKYGDAWATSDGVHWTLMTDKLESASGKACVVYNGRLWLIGGETSYYRRDYSDTDPKDYRDRTTTIQSTADGVQWNDLEPMSVPWTARANAAVVAQNGKIYLLGGLFGNGMLWDVWTGIENAYDAVALNDYATFTVSQGSAAQIDLVVKNNGGTPWGPGQGTKLVVLDPYYRISSFDVPLPATAQVAPGQSIKVSIPLQAFMQAVGIFYPFYVEAMMVQPGIGYFGDRFHATVNYFPCQPLDWRRVSLPTSFSASNVSQLVVFNDKVWANNQCSTDGLHWMTFGSYDKSPWQGRYWHAMAVFHDKLWMMGGTDDLHVFNDVWSSDDGEHWTSMGNAPWMARFGAHAFAYGSYLWILDGWSDPSIRMGSNTGDGWKTGDGKSWTHAADDYWWDQEYSTPLAIYRNKIWRWPFVSGDGESWTQKDYEPNGPGQEVSALVVRDDQLWAFTGGSVMFTSDESHWRASTNLPWASSSSHYYVTAATAYHDQIWVLVYYSDYAGTSYYDLWIGTPSAPLSASSRLLDLGAWDIFAGASAPHALTLTNRGTAPVKLLDAGIQITGAQAGAFQVSGANPELPLAAGASRTLLVTFDPERIGEASSTLRVGYEGPYSPALEIGLTGRGTTTRHDGKALDILGYLMGWHQVSTGLDVNGDGKITIADLLLEPQRAIAVSSPGGGAVLKMGSKQKIVWVKSGAGSKVNLLLYRNHCAYQDIADDVDNSGTYDWTVPYGVIPGSDYTVAVEDAKDATRAGESGSFCEITPSSPEITIQAPSGGEQWLWGSSHDIQWTAPPSIATMRLTLYQGGSYLRTIGYTPNDGTYTWIVPDDLAAGGDYQICIADGSDNNVRDASAHTFAIVKP